MASGLTNQSVSPSEYPVTCKDGNVRQVEFRLATTDNLNIIVFIDVTEHKRAREEREELQSQLYQANKMESIGQLAGGVAHDYNNMLSVIIGFTELAKIKVGPKSPINEDLQEVLTAARRATEISRQLLAFARKQAIRPKVLDLNDAVEQMLKMLRVWAAGVRPWRHAGKAHLAHQALYPFAVDHMAPLIEKDHHSPAAVEWMAGVFLVY